METGNSAFTWVAYAVITAFLVAVVAVFVRTAVLVSMLWLMPLARTLRRLWRRRREGP